MRKPLSVITTIALLLITPGLASALALPPGYTPAQPSPPAGTGIVDDANNYMKAMYGYDEFFEENIDGRELIRLADYDISDIADKSLTYPALFYSGGPADNPIISGQRQYLGTTPQGENITNVRYPLNTSWGTNTYISDLTWVQEPLKNGAVSQWWYNYSKSELKPSIFDAKVASHPEYAAEISRCINIANAFQVRYENGQKLPISRGVENFDWGKYVHIMQAPTYYTWGFGIGFVSRNGSYGYKSFPIAPLVVAEAPDFYPTGAASYQGKPGETVNVIVTVGNKGETGATDFAYAVYGGGWANATYLEQDLTLEKGQVKVFTVPITVESTAQTYVFKANIDGATPAEEVVQDNNILEVTVSPVPDKINLVATGIASGVTGQPVAGRTYTGTAYFRNESPTNVTAAPIGALVNGNRVALKDTSGQAVTTADFTANQNQWFTFSYTVPGTGSAVIQEVINVAPLAVIHEETTYEDNSRFLSVAAAIGGGGQELICLAHLAMSVENAKGEPKKFREVTTAKLGDEIACSLLPERGKSLTWIVNNSTTVDYSRTIAPPAPGGSSSCSYSVMTDWKITSASLHRPEQDPDFTFGHPVWNNKWTDQQMQLLGKKAHASFREIWAADGAYIFDTVTQQMVSGPRYYDLTAKYNVEITYDRMSCVISYDAFGNAVHKHTWTRGLKSTRAYEAKGRILINGTGVTSTAGGYDGDFERDYPHLVVPGWRDRWLNTPDYPEENGY